jgi:adenylate kinase
MDQGQLVPDEVVIGMVDNFMNAHPEAKGFLFDGFPRTTAQCIALDALLEKKSNEINVVLALEVSVDQTIPTKVLSVQEFKNTMIRPLRWLLIMHNLIK